MRPKGLTFGCGQCWRHEERFELWQHLREREPSHMKSCSREETIPLCPLVSASREFRCQTQRRVARQRSLLAFEGAADGLRERIATKIKLLGQEPEIKEILHTAIGNTEFDHRLKIFGNDRFLRIGQETRGWKIKQRGIVENLRFRYNGSPKPMSTWMGMRATPSRASNESRTP